MLLLLGLTAIHRSIMIEALKSSRPLLYLKGVFSKYGPRGSDLWLNFERFWMN